MTFLIIGGIADLPLLRILLAIHQMSQEPGFCKVMNSFVLLDMQAWQLQEPFCDDYYPV